MNDHMRYAGMGSPPCACGCGQMVPPGARYASASHRARAYDQRNPRVNKASPEVLEQSLREALAASEEGFTRQPTVDVGLGIPIPTREVSAEEVERIWPSRHPRTPRVHIDVLAEDAEALKFLAAEVGRTPTDYVRELIRLAAAEAEASGVRGALIGPKEETS